MSSLTSSFMPGASTRLRVAVLVIVTAVVAALLTLVTTEPAVSATDPCAPGGSKIACENSKPGTPPSEWDIEGAGDESIQGFATDISVNVGQKIDFKIDTDARAYSIGIYRLGYYGGDGARKVATVSPSASLPQVQPQCITEAATELYDCGNWAVSASWNVPSTAVSGVYIARLHRADRNDESHITFIVRDDSSTSDVVFQTSDTTWQAYNTYGGSSFYTRRRQWTRLQAQLQPAVPYPQRSPAAGTSSSPTSTRWCASSRRTGTTSATSPASTPIAAANLIKNHKTFLSVGHDEYWSGAQRANVESARDAGVNLMFLSGNEMYWKTRYEPSADCEPHVVPHAWSATRRPGRTPRSTPHRNGPAPGVTRGSRPRAAAAACRRTGSPARPTCPTTATCRSRSAQPRASCASGAAPASATMASGSAQLAPHTVGYESNEDLDNGARPPGLVRLSTTVGPVPEYLQDYGNTVEAGTTTHNVTQYRAASGALVFSAGSVQWTWGLDETHDSPFASEPADLRMKQAQVNLLADMSAQPATLDSQLTPATKSTDTAGPTVDHRVPGCRHRAEQRRHRSPSPAPRPTVAAVGSPASRPPPTAAGRGTRRRAPRPGATPSSSTVRARRPSRCEQSTTVPTSEPPRPAPSA